MLKNKPEEEPKNNFRDIVKQMLTYKNNATLDEHEIIAKVYDVLEIWQIPTMAQIRDEIKTVIKQRQKPISVRLDNFL